MNCPTCGKEMPHKALLTHPPQYQMSCSCGTVLPEVNNINGITCNGSYYMGGDVILFQRYEWHDAYSRVRDGKIIANKVRMTSGNKTGPWLDTWKREDKAMKELARFEIESATDRSSLCAVFARHGYAVKEIELRNDEYGWDVHHFVVVYDKEDK